MLDGPACGFVDLVAWTAPSWPLPQVGSSVWRAVDANGAPLLGVSHTRPQSSRGCSDDDVEAYTWLHPSPHTEVPTPDSTGTLLHSLARVDALLDGTVTAVTTTGAVFIRARVLTPARLSAGAASDATAAAANVVAHLRCDWATWSSSQHSNADWASVASELPACCVPGCDMGCGGSGTSTTTSTQALLDKLLADLRPPRVDTCAVSAPKRDERHPNLGDLPPAVLDAVLCLLDPPSLRAVASTCRALRQRCATLAPGLHLQLHPHQRDALAWMRSREAAAAGQWQQHPLWRCLPSDTSTTRFWGNVLSGEIVTSQPALSVLPHCKGGLLCDEPGLGKTVTVIALVLATRGTWAPPPENAVATGTVPMHGPACRWYIPPPGGASYEEGEHVEKVVEHVMPAAALDASNMAVIPQKRDAMVQLHTTTPPSSGGGRSRRASAEHLSRFGCFAALVSGRSSGGASCTPRARVRLHAALDDVIQSPTGAVFCSKTTLIACPPAVLAHWQLQLRPLIAAGRLTVAVADASQPVDNGAPGACTWLPSCSTVPPQDLAAVADVLLVSLTLFSSIHSHVVEDGSQNQNQQQQHPLLRVRWRRIVLDEGHALGASLGMTSRTHVAQELRAQARWVVTGTPTPAAVAKHGGQLAHLRPLLQFLRHRGLADSARDWAAAVQRPLEAADGERCVSNRERVAAAQRLASVLRSVAVRSRKEDIRLKPLKRVHTVLRFDALHGALYNDLVAHVRRNLLLADWGDPSHEQSLLNSRHAALCRVATDNLRQAACVAGHTVFATDASEVDKSVELLRASLLEKGAAADRDALNARVDLCRAVWQSGRGTCDACHRAVAVPLVTPCGHIVCVHCVGNGAARHGGASSSSTMNLTSEGGSSDGGLFEIAPTGCTVCGHPFQMQAPVPRADNPAPRQAVPQDLIELQPSAIQSGWEVDPQREAQGFSSKVSHLLARLRAIGAAPVETPSGEALAVALARGAFPWPQPTAGRNKRAQQSSADNDEAAQPPAPVLPPVFPVLRHGESASKAIVYSNFASHLHVLDLALTGAAVPFSTLARPGYSRQDKQAALACFTGDPLTRVLLLDRAGAEGLDLSCASHVFLCEPLPDRSLEQQVVSRAHRMGQLATVTVEVLAMEDTAEATLLELTDPQHGTALASDADKTSMVAEALSRRAILTSLRFARCSGEPQERDVPPPAGISTQASGGVVAMDVEASMTAVQVDDGDYGGDAAEGGDAPLWEPPAPNNASAGVHPSDAAPGAPSGSGVPVATDAHLPDARPPRDEVSQWTLRLRGPQLANVTGIEVHLPSGGLTSVAECAARAGAATGLDPQSMRMRGGYPPRELPRADDQAAQTMTVTEAGLRDRDVVHVEGHMGSGSPAAAEPDGGPIRASAPSRRRPREEGRQASSDGGRSSRRFPGKARKLGVGQVQSSGGDCAAGLDAAALAAAGPVAAAMAGAGIAPDVSWLRADGEGARDASALAAGLLQASRGGGGGSDARTRELRSDLARQVEARRAEQLGATRVAAALAGRVQFETMVDGRCHVKYAVPGPRGASSVDATDVFADFPPMLLPVVLRLVAGDTEDPVSRANLQPERMAVASARVFWSIVRHGGVGPQRSFVEALQQLVPELDWPRLTTRDRQRPERYRPNV